MTAEELLRELPKLDPVEFQRFQAGYQNEFAKTIFVMPGIEKTPGVCGGSARLGGSRMPVWLLEEMRRTGTSESKILEGYPWLDLQKLQQAWNYIAAYPEEIEQEIARNQMNEE
jgi:uncharacterized protein (DUF433 family)